MSPRCCLALVLLVSCSVQARTAVSVPMDLSAWTPQPLPKVERQTEWRQVGTDRGAALEARSKAAASGLTRAVDWFGAGELSWRWQVSRSVRNGRLDAKAGDDFAARLYVIFDPPDGHLSLADRAKLAVGRRLFGDNLPRAALCYVWASGEAVGTIAPNAYTDRVRMIVLDQGDAHAGQWREHRRDLAADYEAAFGHRPAPRIIGLSLMSDTDNTGDEIWARFADLQMHPSAVER